MGDQALPLTALRGVTQRVIQRKVDPVLIGADKPRPLVFVQAMIDTVIVAFNPWRQAAKCLLRLLGVQHPGLTGGFAVEQQNQLAFGA